MTIKVTIPKIIVSAEADQKIRHWVDICPVEISGLGLVEEVEDGYLVSEVFLLKQECTGADTELDPMAVADLQMQLMSREDGLQDKLLFWWHSHVNMNVFWSGTDEECVKTCLGNRYLISIVYNKKGESLARIDYGNNHKRITIDNVPVVVRASMHLDDAYDFLYNLLAEKYRGQELTHYDFTKDFFKTLNEFKGVDHSFAEDFDLGFKEFCKKEYDEKVTRKYIQTHTFQGGRNVLGFEKKYEGGKGGAANRVSKGHQISMYDDLDVDDDAFEQYLNKRYGQSSTVDDNIKDVYEFMKSNWSDFGGDYYD